MKVDSGADVCCISAEDHWRLFAQGCACTLCQPDRPLHGPDGKRFDVSGSFPATLEYKGRHVEMTMSLHHYSVDELELNSVLSLG